ncbi:MAG: Asp-tRNA(Asn)/Glu-tRNA(Gln) amidotransferase subunit GatB [Calditrichaeota bacterium]|nr:MAG: Asp-tRNA(Asn)/Glu-tRNA(Gln) amidotransferase subunit GatB [Calditrichota bacterium]
MQYEAVIGLEIHAQLATQSKIFCSCSTAFGAAPNTQVCPVCLALPGALPVLNEQVVSFALKMGLATRSRINMTNQFARKNYFYADLPKGYQISQFELPICEHGHLNISVDGQYKQIGITRIHMEEDAGKSIHDESFVNRSESLVDLNRCGVPLIEIVSEPDMRSADEAAAYLTKIRQLVRYLGICDGNMEEGSLRCDANVSIRPVGQESLGVKTELKNMNSIKNVEKAIDYEIKRQIDVLEDGGEIVQETLLWDPAKNEARTMRGKEDAHDYRYFPDPDLVPVVIDDTWLAKVRADMPELPDERRERFEKEYGLPAYDAEVLTTSRETADYFEEAVIKTNTPKRTANWVMGEVMRLSNELNLGLSRLPVTAEKLADLIRAIEQGDISQSAAKMVFEALRTRKEPVAELIDQLGLRQVSDSGALEEMVSKVLADHPEEVASYKNGRKNVIGFFVGSVMRLSKGKADPKRVNEILTRKLAE